MAFEIILNDFWDLGRENINKDRDLKGGYVQHWEIKSFPEYPVIVSLSSYICTYLCKCWCSFITTNDMDDLNLYIFLWSRQIVEYLLIKTETFSYTGNTCFYKLKKFQIHKMKVTSNSTTPELLTFLYTSFKATSRDLGTA